MAEINLTPAFVDFIHQKGLAAKTLILIADDGGGKYSLQGGACTIGSKFTLIIRDQPDADYPVELHNDAGLHLYSSDYDLLFTEPGLTLDFKDYQIRMKDNAHSFGDNLMLANGQEVLDAFKQGLTVAGISC